MALTCRPGDEIGIMAKIPFYITTVISYPNGPPHIDQAYEAITINAIARS
jgi:methionyl-tRNA synthetase